MSRSELHLGTRRTSPSLSFRRKPESIRSPRPRTPGSTREAFPSPVVLFEPHTSPAVLSHNASPFSHLRPRDLPLPGLSPVERSLIRWWLVIVGNGLVMISEWLVMISRRRFGPSSGWS